MSSGSGYDSVFDALVKAGKSDDEIMQMARAARDRAVQVELEKRKVADAFDTIEDALRIIFPNNGQKVAAAKGHIAKMYRERNGETIKPVQRAVREVDLDTMINDLFGR